MFLCFLFVIGHPCVLLGSLRLLLTMSCLTTMMLNVQDCWEDQLTLILMEISRDYNLDSKKLIGTYILRGKKDLSPVTKETYPIPDGLPAPRPTVVPSGPKKKGGRKPKFAEKPDLDGELTRAFMDTLTIPLLKEACKLRKVPMTGSKDKLIERLELYQRNPQDPGAQKKKGGRKKKEQGPEPAHNHALDGKTHSDCDQCQTYGNPDDPQMQEEEFEIADMKEQLQNIVADMNAVPEEVKEDSDDESGWEEYKEPEVDEDPFGDIGYGDELEEEE